MPPVRIDGHLDLGDPTPALGGDPARLAAAAPSGHPADVAGPPCAASLRRAHAEA